MVTIQIALCLIRRNNAFFLAEMKDRHTGVVLNRLPDGGIGQGESPKQAVRHEMREELGIALGTIEPLRVRHLWFWNGRDVRERARLFLVDASDVRA